jgi:hypothetical protein
MDMALFSAMWIITIFTDGRSGDAGFYATIAPSSMENFPGIPVDVRFKMTAPASVL